MITWKNIRENIKDKYPLLFILIAIVLVVFYSIIVYQQYINAREVPNNLDLYIRYMGLVSIILFLITTSKNVLKRPVTVIIVIFFISVFYLVQIFNGPGYMGGEDWDTMLTPILVAKTSILKYHQLPFWNPYICGGTSLIASYQPIFLDPFALTWLLFPLLIAIKVNLIFYLIVGMIGCYLLAAYLGFGVYSRYYFGIIFMLSGFFAHRMWVGHMNMLVMIYLPYILLYLMKSFKKARYCVICSIFLAVFNIFGNPFTVAILILFFAVLTSWEFVLRLGEHITRKQEGVKWVVQPLFSLLLIVVLTALLSGFRLLPLGEYYIKINPYRTDVDPSLWSWGHKSVLDVYNALVDHHTAYAWHETNAYIGLIAFLFSIYGFISSYKERLYFPLIIFAVLSLMISLGSNSPLDIWGFLHNFPIFISLRIPLRAVMFIMFIVVLFSAKGLSLIEMKDKRFSVLVLVVCLVLLFTSNTKLFEGMFNIQPYEVIDNEGGQFKQMVDNGVVHGDALSGMYPFVLKGVGVTNCYMPGSLQNHAIPMQDPRYEGEVFIRDDGRGKAIITAFSPNIVEVNVTAFGKGVLVLNQNYEKNWKVQGSTGVIDTEGLVSTDVDSSTHKIVFYYIPDTFIYGVLLTIVGLSICILTFRRYGLSIL